MNHFFTLVQEPFCHRLKTLFRSNCGLSLWRLCSLEASGLVALVSALENEESWSTKQAPERTQPKLSSEQQPQLQLQQQQQQPLPPPQSLSLYLFSSSAQTLSPKVFLAQLAVC